MPAAVVEEVDAHLIPVGSDEVSPPGDLVGLARAGAELVSAAAALDLDQVIGRAVNDDHGFSSLPDV